MDSIIGQLLTINVVNFIFAFEFNFILCNLTILEVFFQIYI